MATVCPYCNIEVSESSIEAEDGCCPECGSVISATSSFMGDDGTDYDDIDDQDIFSDLEEDDLFEGGEFEDDAYDDEDLDEEFEDEEFADLNDSEDEEDF